MSEPACERERSSGGNSQRGVVTDVACPAGLAMCGWPQGQCSTGARFPRRGTENSPELSKPGAEQRRRGTQGRATSWVQQTWARLRRPLPSPCPRPFHQIAPWPYTVSPRPGRAETGGPAWDAGPRRAQSPSGRGGPHPPRRCAGRGRAGPAPAARLSAPPIGPESGDSRAEQEGNRSRTRRPRL